MSTHQVTILTIVVFVTCAWFCACAPPPDQIVPADEGGDTAYDLKSTDKAIDNETESPSNETESTEEPTNSDTHDNNDAETESDQDTGTSVETSTETETETETADPGGCPWECVPASGADTCASLGDHWVHNTGYDCAQNKEICCQALGAPNGLTESCADQPAMNCALSCKGKLIENPSYYCKNANHVCCEDPDGPTYGCYDSGGKCISPFENCPAGLVQSPKDCPGLINIDKCCLEPQCPWTCEPDVGAKSCSENTQTPSAVRNDKYSCETPSDICCQPFTPADSDPAPGITEICRGEMTCRPSCEGYEKQTKDFYCKKANMVCCHDPRPPCADIGGKCEIAILGNCSEGNEPNDKGICGNSVQTCCTEIDPSNSCALNGGRCVEIGSSCPTLYLPNFQHFCGLTLKTCCMPIIDML